MKKTADKTPWEKDIQSNSYPQLDKDIDCDVLIIGGGITGGLTSYMFQQKGIDCVVIEKENIASGSTSASTSILHYEVDKDIRMLTSLIGEEFATTAFKMTLDAVYQLEDIVNDLDEDCEFVRRPTLYYTNKEAKVDYMVKEYNARREQKYEVEFLDENTEKFGFPLYAGILTYNSGATVNPVKLTNGLFKHCHKNGMNIYEHTDAKEFDIQEDHVVVKTNQNSKIKCKKVIMCGGYESLMYFDEVFYTMTRTFVLTTKQVENFDGWFGKSIIKNDEDPYLYIRTTKDDRIVIGGEDIDITENDFDKLEMEDNHALANYKYQLLEKKLNSMFPNIKGKEVEYKFNGIFVDSDDGLPYIGETEEYPNIFFNIGLGSNGVLNALIGANLLSELYLNKEVKELEIFKFNR